MTELQAIALVLVALTGTAVVLTREPERQLMVASVFGLALSLLFFTVQAPDVAFSQLVVGGVAMPAMIIVALGRVRRREAARAGEGEDEA